MPVKDQQLYYYRRQAEYAHASKKCYEAKKGTFFCDWCKKGFASKQSMKRHMKKSCPNKPV